MAYITSNERLAMEEQLKEAVLEVLKVRFKNIPYQLKEKIIYCDDMKKLKKLHRQAVIIKSIDALKV